MMKQIYRQDRNMQHLINVKQKVRFKFYAAKFLEETFLV